MNFGSVCSGIEAASVAWHPLGWKAAWLAEIEPFPCAVLAHHYPAAPNLGDMTTIIPRALSGEVEAPDVFTGGTPCQAFSVAGKRESLADARGNLSLTFCEIADAIDDVRAADGRDPCIVVWENVPGVLSTADNAFGCFLGALAGSGCELQPAGGRWTNAGLVLGPKRAVAWRIIDAQYFGLAQRRRRVFVVASARNGFDPAAVLFEFDGVRRDFAPSREARQTAPTIPARSTAGGGPGTDFDCDGGVVQVCPTLRAGGNRTGGDRPPGTDVDTADSLIVQTAHTLRGEGFDASEDGTGRGTLLVPVGVRDCAPMIGANYGRQPDSSDTSAGPMLIPMAYATKLHNTSSNQAGKFYENYTASLDANSPPPAIVFDTTQITSAANYSNPKPGDPCHPLAAGAHPPAIAIRTAQTGSNGWGVNTEGTAYTLDSAQQAVAFPATLSNAGVDVELSPTLGAHNNGTNNPATLQGMAVRRLTPVECERLQGFPDGWTAIPYRKKPASECPDGPRYKSLGNSWAVPVARWVGERIQEQIA